jgi:hypothetical protein
MVKSVNFKLTIQGEGVVNFDGKNQNYFLPSFAQRFKKGNFKNAKFSKKNLYEKPPKISFSNSAKDIEDKVDVKLVISSGCMKRAMSSSVAPASKVLYNEELLFSCLAHPETILQGHMYAAKETIKRKGPVTLGYAEQTNNALSKSEFFSRAGHKPSRPSDITEEEYEDQLMSESSELNKKGTSIHVKETVGKITYEAQGSINISELGFYSLDESMGRYGFNPDKFEKFAEYARLHFGEFDNELGLYVMNNASQGYPEFGFSFTKEQVLYLVKYFLKNLASLRIERSDAYAETSALKIKLVENAIEDRLNKDEGYVDITSESDIDALDFEPYSSYSKVEGSEWEEAKGKIDANIKKANAQSQEDKKTAKSKK